MKDIRNRIVEHLQVRAGDLVPHPLNFRRHPASQRRALTESYREVGFARSLLGYRRADGRIQLIDGHLRRDLDPNMTVTVEVLDVSEEEARKLLLTLDPLAALAEADADVLRQLTAITQADSQVLNDFWQSLAKADAETEAVMLEKLPMQDAPATIWILVGVPVDKFGQVQAHLAALQEVGDVTVQSNRKQD